MPAPRPRPAITPRDAPQGVPEIWVARDAFRRYSPAGDAISHIGLMGSSYTEEHTPDRILLRLARNAGSLVIPDSDYILTLDADSVLLREYCLRLVHQMELPENARVAVIQTPYSAFPGSATRIERLAGATTDLQH